MANLRFKKVTGPVVKAQITGFEKAAKKLQALFKTSVQKRILSKAVREASRPLRAAAAAAMKPYKESGLLYHAQTAKILDRGYHRLGMVSALVGARTKTKKTVTLKPYKMRTGGKGIFRQRPKGAKPGNTIPITMPKKGPALAKFKQYLVVNRWATKYMHLFEGGTKKHKKPRTARNILKRVAAQTQGQFVSIFSARVEREIQAELAKA